LSAQQFETYNGKQVVARTIIFKYQSQLKSSHVPNSDFQGELAEVLFKIQAQQPQQKFPHAYMPDSCDNCVDLSLIYRCEYAADISVEHVLTLFRSLPNIEYAEPLYVESFMFVPNDPVSSSQWHMNTARIYQTWDVETGDSTVTIGITDSGFDIDHSDLIGKIQYNYDDPINGYDDDFDGYVDNFRGWDFGEMDNNPDVAEGDHGTWVAGIASAQTNNSVAIAGVGYKTKFLPIKIATDKGHITRGYEGIVYAADHSCQIINCSWGSDGTYSKYAEDVINYATYNRNALVVAAAGNNNNDGSFYPASYQNTLSVGGVMLGDGKWTASATKGSNWNYYVDVVAPAGGFKSLKKDDGLIDLGGGTSFAAPVVSGIAALVKSRYPDLSALTLGERIRATTDDIYNVPENDDYIHLLGSGRVNALDALVDSVTPSVRMIDYRVENTNGSYMFFPGDTLELYLDVKNYLADATNIYMSVSCEDSYIAPINGSVLFQTFDSTEEKMMEQPLLFEVVETLPADVKTFFKVTYTGDDYFGFEYFPVSFNPSYYNFEFGNIRSTATANSTIGKLMPGNPDEYGFMYKNNVSCINGGSLLFAKSSDIVLSAVKKNDDFGIKQFPEEEQVDTADVLIYSSFENNENAIQVDQYIYGYNDMNALIYEYRFVQHSDSVFTDVFVGPYIDWLIVNQTYNKMGYVDSLQLGYAYSLDPWGIYAGILPLHYHTTNFYAVDDNNGIDSVNIQDGFSDDEIMFTLQHTKYAAGDLPDGGKVSSVSGAYIPELYPDSVQSIRFAVIAGETLSDITATASVLKNMYVTDTTTNSSGTGTGLGVDAQFSASPVVVMHDSFLHITNISCNNISHVSLVNMLGQTCLSQDVVLNDNQSDVRVSVENVPAGVYMARMQCANEECVRKVVIHNK
ncbi:MAG: S8 family serine peptidase, partial [Bacteroidales bacterium]